MNKYLFGIFAIILTFAGKSFAAPLDAYFCFSTQDPQAVVAKFDSYLTSDAAKGLPTVRLWAMLLNGEADETHCVVFENPNGSSFENSSAIFNAPEGQAFLQDLSSIVEDGLEGGGTPIANFGEADFNKNPFLVLYNLRVKNAKRYAELWTELMSSNDFPGSATLFQDTFTGENGRTHYIGMSGPSVDALRGAISESLSSKEGLNFQKRASGIRKLQSTYLMFHVKSWND
tara:strand:+ start:3473 stop:4162 length:690 start_codon:yes stop_codon:yes gene_type:complete